MNFAQMLGCKMPRATEKSRPLAGDFTEKVVIQLPEMREIDKLAPNKDGNPVQSVIHKSNNQTPPPTVEQHPPQENGGSVVVTDSDGHQLVQDMETGWIYPSGDQQQPNLYTPMPMHKNAQKYDSTLTPSTASCRPRLPC